MARLWLAARFALVVLCSPRTLKPRLVGRWAEKTARLTEPRPHLQIAKESLTLLQQGRPEPPIQRTRSVSLPILRRVFPIFPLDRGASVRARSIRQARKAW